MAENRMANAPRNIHAPFHPEMAGKAHGYCVMLICNCANYLNLDTPTLRHTFLP
jgi:hypothetical protein